MLNRLKYVKLLKVETIPPHKACFSPVACGGKTCTLPLSLPALLLSFLPLSRLLLTAHTQGRQKLAGEVSSRKNSFSGQLSELVLFHGYGRCSVLTFSLCGFFGDLFPVIPGELLYTAGTLNLSFGPLIFKRSVSAQRCLTAGGPAAL